MAIVDINYGCGCGVNKKTFEEAVKHADESGHIMTVAGTIKPTDRKAQVANTSSSTPLKTRSHSRQAVTVQPLGLVEDETDFSKLRAKLQTRLQG